MPANKKNINLLLIMPRQEVDSKINYFYTFSLGIAYISSALKKEGYSVDCVNMNHFEGNAEKVLFPFLNSKKYNFVCVGHIALGYGVVEEIIKAVRKHPSNPKIILGGPIITTETELMFNSLKPDFAVIGEGEITVLKLLEALEKNKNLAKVKGIAYCGKSGEFIFTGKRESIENLDSIAAPDFEGFDFQKKLDNSPSNADFGLSDNPRVYPILGSRGCPFSCTFCYHEGKYRTRSVKSILEEINKAVKKYRITQVLLYDDCFAINRERLIEFCEGMKKLRSEVQWNLEWCAQLTVHLVTDEILKILKDSGCMLISYGFESFSQKVLNSMRKPITPQKIDEALKKTLAAKIAIQANFIFGDPAETWETANETLEYWRKNCWGQVSLGMIDPYPGSKIYEHCISKGIIKDRLDFIKNKMSHMFYTNINMSSMSDSELSALKKKIIDYRAKYYVSGKNPILINNALKVTCPFCKIRITYKNVKFNNPFFYEDMFICRNCRMRFRTRSRLKSLAYFLSSTNALYSYYFKIKKFIKVRNINK